MTSGQPRKFAGPPRRGELIVHGTRLEAAKAASKAASPRQLRTLRTELEAVIWEAVQERLSRHPSAFIDCNCQADVISLLHGACVDWLDESYAGGALGTRPQVFAHLERFVRVLTQAYAELEAAAVEPDAPYQDDHMRGLAELGVKVRQLRRQAAGPDASQAQDPSHSARSLDSLRRTLSCPSLDGVIEGVQLMARLDRTVSERPYLEEGAHRLGRWVERCRQHLRGGQLEEARDQLARLEAEVELDAKRLRSAFAKFDRDGSGVLEEAEARQLCVYLGFGAEALEEALHSGPVSLEALAAAVGRAGGVRALLEQRRRGGTRCFAARRAEVGERVRAHFRHQGGKSRSVRDARVLRVSRDDATVEFGMGRWSASQEIPHDWIEDDVDLIEALNDIGIVDDDQHYWTITLPEAEQQVAKILTDCQRSAISHVRTMATKNHSDALPELVQRAAALGIRQEQLWATLAWIRDSAPIIVHVELGRIGPSLLRDTHYRNQFETQTTGGLLCPVTRTSWEHDLFVGAYDEAESFERPKYGVLDVMNDPRGVLSAQQYGDSYLVLTNARLRCTFSPEDSGGLCASQLAVLDQYAHVLLEYGETELLEVVRVANAAEGSEERIGDSRLLENCRYKEVQIHGEISLESHVARLVAHERHRADARHRWALRGGGTWPEADFGEQQVQALCAKQGWELVWMGDERLRRVCEERKVLAREDSQDSRGDFWQHLPHPEGARVPGPPNGGPRTASQEAGAGTGGARSSADASFSLQSSGSLDSSSRLWERAARFGMGSLSSAMREELSATLRVVNRGEEPTSG